MKIKLIKEIRSNPIEIEVEDHITIEDLVDLYQGQVPYTVLAAKKDNLVVSLAETVTEGALIEFLDMRTQVANRAYQHSVSLIYLKAVKEILGNGEVSIEYSINKGLYTDIEFLREISDADIAAVEARMREIVAADIPIKREELSREAAMDIYMEEGYIEKARLLAGNPKADRVELYSLDDYQNYFYGIMVPSTRYIEHFSLGRYKEGMLLTFPEPAAPDKMAEPTDDHNLFGAFAESAKWKRLMQVPFIPDLNERIKNGKYAELIQVSEALHEKKIAEIADLIKESGRKIVLIAGPSSSGKTTFTKRLCIQLIVNGIEPLYLGTDDYFVERSDNPKDEYGEMDFECLGAVDIGLFNSNVRDLLQGKTVDLPVFDFIKGTKIFGKRFTSISSKHVLVIEGIHALNEALTPDFEREEKFKIYISPMTQLNIDEHNRIPTTDNRMIRRMIRDSRTRGKSAGDTIKDWPKVRRGENIYIFPYSKEADVFFNSAHLYEMSILKKYAVPLLESIKNTEPEYSEARRLLTLLNFFADMEDDSVIVNNSILREFIGGSIFV